jgi:predicted flavoprotein YhiN
MDSYDVVIIGAGAAGLMAAIAAGDRGARVLLLDGQIKIGAKILVAGGGRCNVTNEWVHPSRFHTESDPAGPEGLRGDGGRSFVGRVLRAFNVEQTHRFFHSRGVPLKLEETGKYFPVSDSARSVLNALLDASREAGVELKTGQRVHALQKTDDGWTVRANRGQPGEATYAARAVILCAGGRALPKSGSDGNGYAFAIQFGHTLIPTTPALTPLLGRSESHAALSGLTLPVRLSLCAAKNGAKSDVGHTQSISIQSTPPITKGHNANGWAGGQNRLGPVEASYDGSFLFTHFGYSGPAALNLSRHVARDKAGSTVTMRVLPDVEANAEGAFWQEFVRARAKKTLPNALAEILPRRLSESIAQCAHVSPQLALGRLSPAQQSAVRAALFEQVLPVTSVADYVKAEATAGGLALHEIEPATMMSRLVPGLFLAGEICDVDGWLGGYNFQWAWSSGTVAGRAAARFAKA